MHSGMASAYMSDMNSYNEIVGKQEVYERVFWNVPPKQLREVWS